MNEIYECGEGKLCILLVIDFGILRQKSFDDCQHIAAAILAGCDIITSWSFKHIVNVKTARGVKTITMLEQRKVMKV